MRAALTFIARSRARSRRSSPSEAPRSIEGGDVVLVDIREPHEYEEAHIAGAKQVPRSYLGDAIEAVVARPLDAGDPLLRLRQPLGASGASTLARSSATRTSPRWPAGSRCGRTAACRSSVPRTLTPEQRERYSRHMLLPEVGVEGQQKLLDAKVLLLGAGGLGSPTALYLAAAGVGTLGIVDDDVVDASNLQRQVIHNTERIGMPKVESAEDGDRGAQPRREGRRAPDAASTPTTSSRSSRDYDVIVDGVDNFPTRYLLNDASVRLQQAGRLGLDPRLRRPDLDLHALRGPLLPLPLPDAAAGRAGAVLRRQRRARRAARDMGLLQATEVIKLVLGVGEPLIGRLLLYDALGTRRSPSSRSAATPSARSAGANRRRSPTRSWACSPTTRPSAPASRLVGSSRQTDGDRSRSRRSCARPTGGETRGRAPTAATSARCCAELAEAHPATREPAVRRRGRAQPLRQRLPQRRGRARARRARHGRRRRRHVRDPAGHGRRLKPGIAPYKRPAASLYFRKYGTSLLESRPCGGRYDDIVEAIGNTPLVELPRLSPEAGRAHLGQARVAQPDRLGQGPRRQGDDRGRRGAAALIEPGQTILEPTSGNTGIALAMICRRKGYPLKVVMPDNVTAGAHPAAAACTAPRSSTRRAPRAPTAPSRWRSRWPRRTPRYYMPYQYGNEANPRAHYNGTARRDPRGARRGRRVRRRPRHRRHADGQRPPPQGGRPGDARSSPPSRCRASSSRACARSTTASSRRSSTSRCSTARSSSPTATRSSGRASCSTRRASSPASRRARSPRRPPHRRGARRGQRRLHRLRRRLEVPLLGRLHAAGRRARRTSTPPSGGRPSVKVPQQMRPDRGDGRARPRGRAERVLRPGRRRCGRKRTSVHRAANAAASPLRYEIDPRSRSELMNRIEAGGQGAAGDLPLAHEERGLSVPDRRQPGDQLARNRSTSSSLADRPISPMCRLSTSPT